MNGTAYNGDIYANSISHGIDLNAHAIKNSNVIDMNNVLFNKNIEKSENTYDKGYDIGKS